MEVEVIGDAMRSTLRWCGHVEQNNDIDRVKGYMKLVVEGDSSHWQAKETLAGLLCLQT